MLAINSSAWINAYNVMSKCKLKQLLILDEFKYFASDKNTSDGPLEVKEEEIDYSFQKILLYSLLLLPSLPNV